MNFPLPRLYPIIDTEASLRRGADPVDLARALARAGAGIAQYRHKGAYSRELFAQAREIRDILARESIPLIVNDRADVALMVGAAGVHAGQDDVPPAALRALLGDSAAIGFSTHNEKQLRQADEEPADYLALGPIFETASKQKPDPVLGIGELRRLRPLTKKPLVAIGGITLSQAAAVFEAGADSVAVISGLLEGDLDAAIERWLEAVEAR